MSDWIEAMELHEIQQMYNEGDFVYHLPEPKLTKVSEGHIFDEDLSVKRNREMVAEHNEKVKAQQKKAMAEQAKLDAKFKRMMMDWLLYNYSNYFNEESAEFFYEKLFSEYHSNMSEFFYWFDDWADFFMGLVDKGPK